ncbi:HAD family hydrolase [Halobacillus mangrovi]|uniref:HAD family hydrolase n=1 Tax=Halobacillus mangrovi TaxID=402384 RepID=UPI003D9788F4
MLDQAKALIFDLDGTLYEDTDHFTYYAKLLKQKLNKENRSLFERDYDSIRNGEHPLAIGKVYDRTHDAIISVDPFTNHAIRVETWTGEQWSEKKVLKYFPEALTYDFNEKIAIGDGWWLPFSTATHYGVNTEDARECYVATKDYMGSKEFHLTKTKGLKNSLLQWKKTKALILVTNSEGYDVDRILKAIDLEGIFEDVISNAEKPVRTEDIFQEVLHNYRLKPEETISIGDNFMNEIAPALEMGMKGIYIQSNDSPVSHPNLKVIESLEELCTK